MDLASRLKLYIENKKLQNSVVADTAGIPRPTLSQLLTGRNKKASTELIEKLHAAYPDLNMLWLLFGDGPMEVAANIKTSEAQNGRNDGVSSMSTIKESNAYDPITGVKENAAENGQKNEQGIWFAASPAETASLAPGKRVQSIMVFYSDNSFEVFEPAKKSGEEI